MKVKLGFGETRNKRFLVMVELIVTSDKAPPEPILAFTYEQSRQLSAQPEKLVRSRPSSSKFQRNAPSK